MALRVTTCAGQGIVPYLDDLARLRMAVFREYPYRYDGDMAYERDYLQAYARSAGSVFVLAFDDEAVVGASSGMPLVDDGEAFQQPFIERGMAVSDVYYFGESVLLSPYRGHGIGHRFFDEREAHARRLGGFALAAFCSVERGDDDPHRPAHYRANDAFWRKRGYRRQDAMFCRLDWKELGSDEPVSHRLRFWLRPLDDQAGSADG